MIRDEGDEDDAAPKETLCMTTVGVHFRAGPSPLLLGVLVGKSLSNGN